MRNAVRLSVLSLGVLVATSCASSARLGATRSYTGYRTQLVFSAALHAMLDLGATIQVREPVIGRLVGELRTVELGQDAVIDVTVEGPRTRAVVPPASGHEVVVSVRVFLPGRAVDDDPAVRRDLGDLEREYLRLVGSEISRLVNERARLIGAPH